MSLCPDSGACRRTKTDEGIRIRQDYFMEGRRRHPSWTFHDVQRCPSYGYDTFLCQDTCSFMGYGVYCEDQEDEASFQRTTCACHIPYLERSDYWAVFDTPFFMQLYMKKMVRERQNDEKVERDDLLSSLLAANDHDLDGSTLSEDELIGMFISY